ncbi:hypothetical protein G7046_g6439 [Stylonectria norvegica]|nr:hypothetical protein G7046_g6439 [Stylonectria norvegica]
MATATQIQLMAGSSITMRGASSEVNMEEAIRFANLCKEGLNVLAEHHPDFDHSHPYTADEVLALPMDEHRIDDALHDLPRRKSQRHTLAVAIASLLYPVHEGSLTAIIRYEGDRVRLRGWAALQRKHAMLQATVRNGHAGHGLSTGVAPGVRAPIWASRITSQGPWDPAKMPISLQGTKAIPMPVHVADAEDLAPFLAHLQNGGTHELKDGEQGSELDGGKGEPYYGVKGAEFRKGVVYEDGRMDLCKMVVGPDHIGNLMQSLRSNEFVRHFLLGNNIIGPVGAREVAKFIEDFPDRMDTWYLAGNCIDGAGFKILVDAMVQSKAVTNIWLKRNPLGPDAAEDVFRLITGAKNLRTLDLDQTELGDRGVAHLFNRLATHSLPEGSKLPLQNIYLNGVGISVEASQAIGKFLASPHCGLNSIYMSLNPLGNEGVEALAAALPKAPYLARLSLQSVGVSTQGAIALCEAATGHPGLQGIDLNQAFATQDLGQAYNYIEDAAVPAISDLLKAKSPLAYLNLGFCALTPPGVIELAAAVLQSPTLVYYTATSILPDPTRPAPTFRPALDAPHADHTLPTTTQIKTDKALREHLEANVRARYGEDMSYAHFIEEEKRWLVNDKTDVRKIDSVYRNRDAGLARRHLMTLVKDWGENDDTLERVMKAQGAPSCSLRRAGLKA